MVAVASVLVDALGLDVHVRLYYRIGVSEHPRWYTVAYSKYIWHPERLQLAVLLVCLRDHAWECDHCDSEEWSDVREHPPNDQFLGMVSRGGERERDENIKVIVNRVFWKGSASNRSIVFNEM